MPEPEHQPEPRKPECPVGFWQPALRHLLNRAPCFLPAMAVLGAALGGYGWGVAALAMLLAWWGGMWRQVVACIVCASIVQLCYLRQERESRPILQDLANGGITTFTGTVVQPLSNGGIVSTGWNGARVAVYGRGPLSCGDVLEVTASVREMQGPLVPGMFDTARWMRGQGVCAGVDLIRCRKINHGFSWAGLRGTSRDVRASLERRLMPPGAEDDPRRQVLCALVLGDKSGADPATMLDFQRGGCMHAFAVSGLHVGLVAGIFLLVLRLLHVHPAVSRWVLLVGVACYVWVTGMAVPAMRAYLMLAAVLGARILVRQVSLLNIWSFSGLLLLLLEPWQVEQSGFQLSFAVYGALCVGVRLCMRDAPWFGPDPYIPYRIRTDAELRMRSIERAVRGVVLVAVCAWLGSLPLTCGHFHAFSTYGVFTNIVITPILPLVMGAGMLAMACSGIPWLCVLTDALAVKASGVLIAVVSFFSGLPHSYVPLCTGRAPQESLVVQLRYGNSVCMLGNPGLLIDCGSERDVRYTVQPLLFHDGFTPAALLQTRNLSSVTSGQGLMKACWRGLPVLQVPPGSNTSLTLKSGTFDIYGAPADIATTPADNTCPVVLWKSPRGLVVYIGDAALPTLESVPVDLSDAAWVILGHNKKQPVDARTVAGRMPGAEIILLPTAFEAGVRPESFTPLQVREMNGSVPMIRLEPAQFASSPK